MYNGVICNHNVVRNIAINERNAVKIHLCEWLRSITLMPYYFDIVLL